MHTEQKWEKLVSNRTDSSVSVDERQIQESRGGWQRSLPLPDLSRKIEGPLLAGYLQAGYVAMSDGNLSDTSHVAYYICQRFGEKIPATAHAQCACFSDNRHREHINHLVCLWL